MKHVETYNDFMTIIKKFNINDIIYNKHGFFIKDKVWLEPGEKFIVTDKDKHFYAIKYLKTDDTITERIFWILTNFISEKEWEFNTNVKKFNL